MIIILKHDNEKERYGKNKSNQFKESYTYDPTRSLYCVSFLYNLVRVYLVSRIIEVFMFINTSCPLCTSPDLGE